MTLYIRHSYFKEITQSSYNPLPQMERTPTLINLAPDHDGRDNITDWCLNEFRKRYRNNTITKDHIWEYLYGVMHAPDWRKRYRYDLQRNLPRVPFAPAQVG